jgi:hypothetical protein
MKGPDAKALSYLWYSIQVCSVEDVGYGCPEAVGLALYGGLSATRLQFGDAFLSGIIKMLCDAPKSRACAEISLWGDFHSLDKFKQFAALFSEQLLEKIGKPATSSMVTQDAYIAQCVLRGLVPRPVRGFRRPLDRPALEKIQEWLMSTGEIVDMAGVSLTETDRWVAAACADRGSDPMHCAMLPAMIGVRPGTTVTPDPMTEETTIRSVTSVAFDQHTGIGKIVMKAFHTSLSKDYPAIKQIDAKAMGALVFCVEGSLVDYRLCGTEVSKTWRRMHDEAFCVGKGVPLEVFDECMEIVGREIPRLNEKRKWASDNNIGG